MNNIFYKKKSLLIRNLSHIPTSFAISHKLQKWSKPI